MALQSHLRQTDALLEIQVRRARGVRGACWVDGVVTIKPGVRCGRMHDCWRTRTSLRRTLPPWRTSSTRSWRTFRSRCAQRDAPCAAAAEQLGSINDPKPSLWRS